MQTLFIITFSAFLVAALTWFGIWAFRLHPSEGWLGKDVVAVTPLHDHERLRKSPWFRALKALTVALGLIASALFVRVLRAG
jgi:hypothetical protein